MGELIHIEIKTLVRFNGVGHCISTDCEGQSIRRGTGGEYVYVCFAEASRVSFTDIFPDQRATIARALRAAAVAYYNSFRVTVTCVKTDTDSCYKAFAFRDDYKHLGRRYVCTGPLTQRTNSNAERLIKTILTKPNNPNQNKSTKAIKRPSAKNMIQRGAVESAIANTLAVLAGNGSNYCDLFEIISQLNLQNEELLDELDEKIKKAKCNRAEIDKKSIIPRTLVESYGSYRSQQSQVSQRSPSVCQFLKAIAESNNLSGNSESVLIERLTAATR